jgi:hypothetical protein
MPAPSWHAARSSPNGHDLIAGVAGEWIDAGSALLGVIVGGGITFLIALLARNHERTMAREAREQERLADTYVRMLFTARRFGESTQGMTARLSEGSEQGADELRRSALPELKEILEVEALLDAYSSEAARTRFDAWHKVVSEVPKAWKVISKKLVEARERDELAHVDFGDLDRQLDKLKQREQFARFALVQQVRSELRPHGKREE